MRFEIHPSAGQPHRLLGHGHPSRILVPTEFPEEPEGFVHGQLAGRPAISPEEIPRPITPGSPGDRGQPADTTTGPDDRCNGSGARS